MRLSAHYRIPIGQLQATMTSIEFIEACAFATLEPYGELVANHRAPMICATIANAAAGGKKNYTPEQFPIVQDPIKVAKPLALVDKWKAFVALKKLQGQNHGSHSKSSR